MMIAVRQFSNSSSSLNPFNSIPQAQPTTTPNLPLTLSFAGGLAPTGSAAAVPLASSASFGISPSQASVIASIVGGLRPTFTESITLKFPSETAMSVVGSYSRATGTASAMAALGSSSGQTVQPTNTAVRTTSYPSLGFPFSVLRSTTTETSFRSSVTTSATRSTSPLVTTSTSFTTVSPTSRTSTSSSSSSTQTTSTSRMNTIPVAKATATPAAVSTESKPGLSSGAIAGITFGTAAAVALLSFLLFLCLRKRKTNKPPSIYPEEAYLYDPPITPPSNMAQTTHSVQPWMRGNTAYYPTTQFQPGTGPMIPNSPPMIPRSPPPMIPHSPPMMPNSPPMRAVTPDGYERVGLLGIPEGQQDMAMLGQWPSLRRGNSASYRPLGTGRGYRLPPLHEDLPEVLENDPRNPFRDPNVT